MKKDFNIEMGARIKAKRLNLRYTRETFAELVDISPQFLADIEYGKKGMSFTTLKKICKCLACRAIISFSAKSLPASVSRYARLFQILTRSISRLLRLCLAIFCKLLLFPKRMQPILRMNNSYFQVVSNRCLDFVLIEL